MPNRIVSFRDINDLEKAAIDLGGKLLLNNNDGPVIGKAILVGGTVTVNTTAVNRDSYILYSRIVKRGALGELSIGTIADGSSFVIESESNTETSTIVWFILGPVA